MFYHDVCVRPAAVQLTINEKNRQWGRSEAEVMINGEKASFPIREVCEFRYAKDAAIILPKGFKKVDINTGKSEFSAVLMAF